MYYQTMIFTVPETAERMLEPLAALAGGYTLLPVGRGGWFDNFGNLITEESQVIVVIHQKERTDKIYALASVIARETGQEEVWCTTTLVEFERASLDSL